MIGIYFMNISNMNLNLLVSLDALLTERNVTRAGKKIFITQSAMSNVLKQLRDVFHDALLVPIGRTMQLTDRAKQLHLEIKKFISQAENIFNFKPFDPSRSDRQFIIGMEEYTGFALLPMIYTYLSKHAPNIKLFVKNIPVLQEKHMLESQEIELAIGFSHPDNMLPTHYQDLLFKEKIVCIVGPHHPLAKKKLTLKRYLEAEHVSIAINQTQSPSSIIDLALNKIGYQRQILLKLSHIVPALYTIKNSNLIATVPEGVAKEASQLLNFSIKPCPFSTPEVSFLQTWHPLTNNDAGSDWLRNVIKNVAKSIHTT